MISNTYKSSLKTLVDVYVYKTLNELLKISKFDKALSELSVFRFVCEAVRISRSDCVEVSQWKSLKAKTSASHSGLKRSGNNKQASILTSKHLVD